MAKLLVIEDEVATRKLMCLVLSRAGHEVRAAASGAEALAALDDFVPDLLLSDWLLAAETGYDVTLAVRARVPGVRALFITGFPVETVAAEARQVSPWSILEKPVDVDGLLIAVSHALDSLGVPRSTLPA